VGQAWQQRLMTAGLPEPLAAAPALLTALLIGGLIAAVAGYLVGLPSLRLRGDYLAIVTLGFGEIIRVLILNIDVVGGARGLPGIPAWVNLFWIGLGVVGVVLVSRHLAGGLFAHFLGYLNPSTFSFIKSIEVIAMVVLGGLGSISGAILAAIVLTLLPEVLRPVKDYRMVIYALMLIVLMITRPQGLMGAREIDLSRWFRPARRKPA
jgi:branched-chain amino acid transport system permease protein